jgi:ATP-dependent exoDNAse (exonuclease V) alpha subunit
MDNTPVRICIGAKVMLTYNFNTDNGLCNGAKGVVIDVNGNEVQVKFDNGQNVNIGYVNVYDDDDNHIMAIMPLRLAYAITINKCQGMTLDNVVIWMDDFCCFKEHYGRLYTALSRARSISNIQVVGRIRKSYFDVHPDILETKDLS